MNSERHGMEINGDVKTTEEFLSVANINVADTSLEIYSKLHYSFTAFSIAFCFCLA
jgi:hypothetical protein